MFLLSALVLARIDIPALRQLNIYLKQVPSYIGSIETAFVSVIVSASVIYLGFLAWRKFKESANRV